MCDFSGDTLKSCKFSTSSMTTQLLSGGECCKLRYDAILVKSAYTNVPFYTDNSKMPNFELWHSRRIWAIFHWRTNDITENVYIIYITNSKLHSCLPENSPNAQNISHCFLLAKKSMESGFMLESNARKTFSYSILNLTFKQPTMHMQIRKHP